MTAPQITYAGPDRRTGFERRTVAPKEAKGGPKLVNAIHVPGEGTFGPGQEKKFHEAAGRANDLAKKENRGKAVDLDALEAAGAIRGFGKKSDVEEPQSTRSNQREPGTKHQVVEVKNDNAAHIPGAPSFDTLNPVSPPKPQGPATTGKTAGAGTKATSTTAARTGGAGKTEGGDKTPTVGERLQADADAKATS